MRHTLKLLALGALNSNNKVTRGITVFNGKYCREGESDEKREERLRRRERDSLRRERETAEERHTSGFVNTDLSQITFCNGI